VRQQYIGKIENFVAFRSQFPQDVMAEVLCQKITEIGWFWRSNSNNKNGGQRRSFWGHEV